MRYSIFCVSIIFPLMFWNCTSNTTSPQNTSNTWNQVELGQSNPTVYSLLDNGAALFAGTSQGVFRSMDQGQTWTAVLSDSINDVCSLFFHNGTLFAGTSSAGIWQSANSGNTWNRTSAGLSPVQNFFPTISAFVEKGDQIFAASPVVYLTPTEIPQLFVSEDGGLTWQDAASGIQVGVKTLLATNETVLAGTFDGIFRMPDDSSQWTQIGAGSFEENITAFVSVGNKLLAGTADGLFVSTNNGSGWTKIDTDTLVNFTALTAIQGRIFAGTESDGVFISNDDGATWTPFGSDFPVDTPVYSLVATDRDLFVGTLTGLWHVANEE